MRFLRLAVVVVVLASCAGAQEASSPSAVPPQVPAEHPGAVILSRSVEDGGSAPVAAATPAAKAAEAPSDAERQAITFLSYDLEVQLRPG